MFYVMLFIASKLMVWTLHMEKSYESVMFIAISALQTVNEELQFSDRGDYGCPNLNVAPKFSQNVF